MSTRSATRMTLLGISLCLCVAVPTLASAGSPFDDAMVILKDAKQLSKKLDTAQTKLEEAIKADPKNAHASYNLGLVHQRKGNTGEARKAWQRTLQVQPGYQAAKARLAELDLRAGQTAAAKSALEEIIKADRFQPEARNLLAEIALGSKNWEEAIVHARNVLLGDPNDTNAYLNMAIAYYRQGLVDQAWLIVSNALARKPEAAALHNMMGLIHLQRDDSRSATDSFLKSLETDPDQQDALLNLATLELSYGAFKSALKRFDKAVKRAPRDADLVLSRAVALRGLERYDDAAKGYEQALTLRPGWLDAEYNLCVLHHQYTQQYEAALTRCQSVLNRLDKKHVKLNELRRRVKSLAATIEALKEDAAQPGQAPQAPPGQPGQAPQAPPGEAVPSGADKKEAPATDDK